MRDGIRYNLNGQKFEIEAREQYQKELVANYVNSLGATDVEAIYPR